jgi:N-acyl-D-aspartate/D-glutamate deacylase
MSFNAFDIIIKDAKIVDGTGRPAYNGSIGIKGERITAVTSDTNKLKSARIINGTGLVASPGFIDPHSHADLSILQYPRAENLIMQGITTFVGGNCGISLAPVKDMEYFKGIMDAWGLELKPDWKSFDGWLSKVESAGHSPNYVPLVGHNAVRGAVMGDDFKRKASGDEIKEMKRLLTEAIDSGAFGFSAGFDAASVGHFADVDEVVELARIAGKHGGMFAPHTRHHQSQWPADNPSQFGYGLFHAPKGEIITGRYHGLLEAVEISRLADMIPLNIAHLTPAYSVPQPHPHFLDEALAKATLTDIVDSAIDGGINLSYNVIAWSQSIGSQLPVIESFFSPLLILPDWMRALEREEFADKLKNREFRNRVKNVIYGGNFKFGMLHPITDPYWMDCYRILTCKNREYEGKTVGQIAREKRPHSIIEAVYDESVETVFNILVDDPGATWALIIDKREYGALPTFLKHPAGMPCTDVHALPASPSSDQGVYGYGISPTAFGLFPHYIRLFVKEEKVLTIEEAVMKATSVPASRVLGLSDRGVLKEGFFADVVVFSLDKLKEGEDFLEPSKPPEGISSVIVNGKVVYENMKHTGETPGKVLRKT